jgi:hypothetical protein
MKVGQGRRARTLDTSLVVLAAICALAGSLDADAAGAAEQRVEDFAFTATSQLFVVPAGVTSVHAVLIGGHGGAGSERAGSEARGGEGEQLTAQVSTSPGELLFVEVAGNGESGASPGHGRGGYDGGGNAESHQGLEQDGGGGGGGSAGLSSTMPSTAYPGGAGGEAGARGQEGAAVPFEVLGGNGGLAGTAGAGGSAGGFSSSEAATAGSEMQGGNAGASGLNLGGGGGGGIFGGGGGGGGEFLSANPNFFGGGSGGGGGGSSGIPAGSAATLLGEEATSAPAAVTLTWTAPAPSTVTTAPGEITTTTATLNGTVNPDGSAVSECHFSITPAPPAGGVLPCAQQVGAGDTPVAVSAAATALTPGTVYQATLVATSTQGTSTGTPIQFETVGFPVCPVMATSEALGQPCGSERVAMPPPFLSALKLSPTSFRRGTRAAVIATTKRSRHQAKPAGATMISFDLSESASVSLNFERKSTGVTVGHSCISPSKRHRRGRPCTLYTAVSGAVIFAAPAGSDRITFDGVLEHGARLALGSYRLTATASTHGTSSTAAQHPTFMLLR